MYATFFTAESDSMPSGSRERLRDYDAAVPRTLATTELEDLQAFKDKLRARIRMIATRNTLGAATIRGIF